MNRTVCTIGDCLDVKHGFAFEGQYFTDVGDYVVLTPGNFFEDGGFRFRPEKERYYSIEPPAEYILKKGAIIIAMTEQAEGLLGSSVSVPFDNYFLHNQRLGLLVFDRTKELCDKFFYYLFNTKYVRDQIKATASGTKVRHTSPSRIKSVQFSLPSFQEQLRIANVLSTYDNLIENNKRRIDLLEESANLLYKEWFVNLRFPGHEHVKKMDDVPDDWEKKPLKEVANYVMGQSPSSEFYNEDGEGLPFHQGVADYGERFVVNRVFSTVNTRIANEGDILCSVRAPVGRLNITRERIGLGRGLCGIRSRFGAQNFLYYQLKSYFVKEDMIGTGAIYASVNKDELGAQLLMQPNKRLICEFEDVVKPIDNQILNLTCQNNHLIKARDLLLPKLISGEIAV